MEFINPEIQRYADKHTSSETELLSKIDRETNLQVLRPRMLSGHFQGRVLSMISKMVNPKRILEIGTYTGYSAICLSEGLQNDGKLFTVDNNRELEDRVRKYFKESGFASQITFIIGQALEVIQELEETFDLVFIDADKSNYLNYYKMILPKVRSGGIVIADNVLWSGKVIEKVKPNDIDTPALQEFNDFVQSDDSVENVLFPVRDGLMVIMKK